MKKVKIGLRIFIFMVILTCISIVVIIKNGKTYVLKIGNLSDINSINELNIEIEKENGTGNEIVKCIDKSFNNGELRLKLESVNSGKTFININKTIDKDVYYSFAIYVHKYGTITFNSYYGESTGSIIVPISVIIFLAYVLFILIKIYRQKIKENIYRHENISYLGLIIFLSFSLFNQIFGLMNYHDLSQIISDIISACSDFSILLLPIAFVVSILVIISNIVLIKKEGLKIRNLLGIFLGFFFCFLTIFPEILNQILYSATWIDVHNDRKIGVYIQMLIETVIYVCVSYFECILLGTIILSIKSAKHIPDFNKDYILILGCKIKSDGTLSNLLKGRVDKAIEFSKMQKENTGKELDFIPSGGQGEDEVVSEAEAMKKYLIKNGIKEEKILIENKSKNTYQNIKFSDEIIESKMKDAKVVFSTTNYHVFRAGIIANEQNISMEGIGAKAKTYFWINAFIREFIATLYYGRKNHIMTLLLIILSLCNMIGLIFLSRVI